MTSKKWKSLMVATVVASAMTMATTNAMAQSAADKPVPDATRRMGQDSRFATIQQLGLNDPALKLTTAQRAEIDKAIHAYVVEQNAALGKSTAKSTMPQSQDALAARSAARESLAASVSKVLTSQQRETWEAARATRQAQRNSLNLSDTEQRPARHVPRDMAGY